MLRSFSEEVTDDLAARTNRPTIVLRTQRAQFTLTTQRNEPLPLVARDPQFDLRGTLHAVEVDPRLLFEPVTANCAFFARWHGRRQHRGADTGLLLSYRINLAAGQSELKRVGVPVLGCTEDALSPVRLVNRCWLKADWVCVPQLEIRQDNVAPLLRRMKCLNIEVA